ncbi:MAG: hypothetical protein IJM46_15085 [Oscillospiraceae bacterium]|nr:hypothetical protein [Oscillospiraceae bacterium]
MTLNKIKILVWREWRICRKTYLSSMFSGAVLVSFFWLIRLSVSYGNLAPVFAESELLAEFSGLLYYMSAAMVAGITAGMSADPSALLADVRANWMRYSFVLPVSPAQRSVSIYIVRFIKYAIGFAITAVNGIVSAKANGIPFTGDMMWFFAAVYAATMLYNLLLQWFYSQARTVRQISAAQVKTMGVLTGLIMIYMCYKMIIQGNNNEADSLDVMINSLREKFITHENIIIPLTVIVLIAAPLTGWYFTALHYRTHGDVKEDTQPKKRFSFGMRKEKDGEAV